MKARLKKKADQEGIPVKDLRVRSTKAKLTDGAKSLSKRRLPIIESKRPGSLHLDNAKIYELIDFP
jgi:hypothetical protein